MPNRRLHNHFTLTAVRPLPDMCLHLEYADGAHMTVRLPDSIRRHPLLAELHQPDVFASVALDEWEMGIMFNNDDNLQLAADNLRAWAIEQTGQASHETVIKWMYRHNLSVEAAALALGMSKRMLNYYRSGQKPVPRTVALAMRGWEVEQMEQAA